MKKQPNPTHKAPAKAEHPAEQIAAFVKTLGEYLHVHEVAGAYHRQSLRGQHMSPDGQAQVNELWMQWTNKADALRRTLTADGRTLAAALTQAGHTIDDLYLLIHRLEGKIVSPDVPMRQATAPLVVVLEATADKLRAVASKEASPGAPTPDPYDTRLRVDADRMIVWFDRQEITVGSKEQALLIEYLRAARGGLLSGPDMAKMNPMIGHAKKVREHLPDPLKALVVSMKNKGFRLQFPE